MLASPLDQDGAEPAPVGTGHVRAAFDEARRVQRAWAERTLQQRLGFLGALRPLLVERLEVLCSSVQLPQRRTTTETLSAEVLPLADACKFLQKQAPRLLRARRLGGADRPFWLRGASARVEHRPHGVVLILAPSNYPLLLPGVQALQALVAGNAVIWKPGRYGAAAARCLVGLLEQAGLPRGLVQVLNDSPDDGRAAVEAGPDALVLTGSRETGRAVAAALSQNDPIPTIFELSGCDAFIVQASADPQMAAAGVRFGLSFNGSFTCLAPRRLFVHRDGIARFEQELRDALQGVEPVPIDPQSRERLNRWTEQAVEAGARLVSGTLPAPERSRPVVLTDVPADSALWREDLAAPVACLDAIDSDDEAVTRVHACDYRLGATVYGAPQTAEALARRLDVGVVVVNDYLVPTADPRLPFGGHGASGTGRTRGAEGLLQMTRTRVVSRRAGSFRPHHEPVGPEQANLVHHFLTIGHGRTWSVRLRAIVGAARSIAAQVRKQRGSNG